MSPERDIHVDMDPSSPKAREARALALRLLAARLGSSRTGKPGVYHGELNTVTNEAIADVEILSHLVAELTEAAWTLLHLVREDEDVDVNLDWLRALGDEAVIAVVEGWLDTRGQDPPPGS